MSWDKRFVENVWSDCLDMHSSFGVRSNWLGNYVKRDALVERKDDPHLSREIR